MFFDAFIDRPDYNGRRIHLLIIWAACLELSISKIVQLNFLKITPMDSPLI
jgi:hypothetical protein